ncbi:hypothetical protein D1AOALGA4SA_12055 [Olavius algarvensis Delta 1 endosymbiont]|nr:hypothetical protein D1AOALGA4SA_12055 [Olavius algarvensis Delta 1 endosymbiont]
MGADSICRRIPCLFVRLEKTGYAICLSCLWFQVSVKGETRVLNIDPPEAESHQRSK